MSNEHDDQHLLWQLRALHREAMPAHDLWPGIAARIAQVPQASAQSTAAMGNLVPLRRHRAARLAPLALAASLVLAVGVAWQQRPQDIAPAAANAGLLTRQADAMTREYEGALRELQAAGTPAASANDALHQLDTSAMQIRAALGDDPEARFLLDRLRRTYEKRLQLTQRATLA